MIAPSILVAAFLAIQSATPAAVRLPADQRIEARVAGSLKVPTSQPMHMPTDVAVDSKGRVFVADGSNDRVVRFNRDGQFDTAIDHAGGERFSQPVGIAVDDRERLWIADTGNHRLIVLGADGEPAERIDLPSGDKGKPVDPTDIAIAPGGTRTYIVDNDHHRILVRDNLTGAFTTMGRFGQSIGQFQWPFMIDVGADGYVYVSEAIGARVQRMRGEQWAGQLGRWGVEAGRLYRPKGIVIDVKGRVYVSDSTLGVIQVFDTRGGFIGVLTGGREGEPLRFDHPMGMCFDKTGRLYVVELAQDRVAVVELPEKWLPTTQPDNEVAPQ